MRILLIQAKLLPKLVTINPPHGLMYISAVCKQNGYKDIKILHLDIFDKDWKNEILKFRPDIVGIGSITAQGKSMHEIAEFVKENTKAKVIVGGAYPTYYYQNILKDKNIDICVIGEGEKTFLKIIKYYENKIDISEIPSIAYVDKTGIKINHKKEIYDNLDELPFPDYQSIDVYKYQKLVNSSIYTYGLKTMTIYTSRGCPFDCIFCHKVHGKSFRAHSPKRVIEEIKYLHDAYGIKAIDIMDDIANFNPNRFNDILKMFKKELPQDTFLYFSGGLSAKTLTEENIEIMSQSRVKYFAIAVESGSERVQKLIKKNLDLKKTKELIDYAVKKGLYIHGLFMIGFPFETQKDVEQTIDFMKRSKLHTMILSTAMAYKGTELAKMVDPAEIKNINSDRFHYSDYEGFIKSGILSETELKKLKFKANAHFYYSPIRIFRILRSLPSKNPKLLWILILKFLKRSIIK